jgi:hypothetical protein
MGLVGLIFEIVVLGSCVAAGKLLKLRMTTLYTDERLPGESSLTLPDIPFNTIFFSRLQHLVVDVL